VCYTLDIFVTPSISAIDVNQKKPTDDAGQDVVKASDTGGVHFFKSLYASGDSEGGLLFPGQSCLNGIVARYPIINPAGGPFCIFRWTLKNGEYRVPKLGGENIYFDEAIITAILGIGSFDKYGGETLTVYIQLASFISVTIL
jgi:hypothetical protein